MDDPVDFLKIQSKLRNNNEDIESFMRDISSWQDEMNVKDSQLSNKSSHLESSSDQHMDDKENNSSALLPRLQRAAVEKDKGNEYFKKGEFQKAIDCYTEGLKCDPKSAILPANRAMALLKLNREREAEKDCTLAISLDPTYAKAYIRRAYARAGLKRYSDAITDYEKVLEIEPKNKMAKTEMEKLLLKSQKSGEKEKKVSNNTKSSFEENMKNAFQKKPTKSSVESHMSDRSNELQTQGSEESNFIREISTKKIKTSNSIYPIDKPPHLRSKKPLRRINIVDIVYELPEKKNPETDMESTIEKDLSQSLEEVVQVSSPKKPSPLKKLSKPKNSVQFYCTWRSLENDDERGDYLRLIAPNEYAGLFRHSLESDVLSGMIRVLKEKFLIDSEQKKLVPDILIGLSTVERLSVLILFLGDEERGLLSSILGSIKEMCDSDQMKKINKCFA